MVFFPHNHYHELKCKVTLKKQLVKNQILFNYQTHYKLFKTKTNKTRKFIFIKILVLNKSNVIDFITFLFDSITLPNSISNVIDFN